METEVHVYAFSVAANVLLSFFPFLIVMASFCRYVLHWRGAESAIYLALSDYLPGNAAFLSYNVSVVLKPLEWASMVLLLFTANGVFEPLEVALNRVWGVTKNRSFLKNQVLSLGLIFACGSLVLLSTVLTAWNQELWGKLFASGTVMSTIAALTGLKIAGALVTVLILVLIYWKLPNREIPLRLILPTAVSIGLALEALKYVNLLTWPFLGEKLHREYGPFINSVSIILWSFFASMVVLAGAEWTARHTRAIESSTTVQTPPASYTGNA
jgi:uncharacterized BrkB/YihY/UPF0761 family membrane protein